MLTISDVTRFLEKFAPLALAESWDNVGLLVGDATREAARVMTCLTVTPTTAAEAIDARADLIVAHHPLPFHPLQRLTTDTTAGRLLWDLIAARVSIYSPHTAFDSAQLGINQRLAEGLQLGDISPLVPGISPDIGAGRQGLLTDPMPLTKLVQRVKEFLKVKRVHCVGESNRLVSRVSVACGSGGDFLSPASQAGCDVLLTGEARFHACLEAEATGIALIMAGHYATERFGVEHLAGAIAQEFPSLKVWASRTERDPIEWL